MKQVADGSPLFFPQPEAKVKQQLHLIILHERPKNKSRCTLSFLQQKTEDLFGYQSLSGIHQALKRFGISYQRGRPYIHSPDKDYLAKLIYLKHIISEAAKKGIVVVFQDEFTLTNQVGSAATYAPKGQQPKEQWAYEEQKLRLAGAMNALSGKTTIHQCDKMSIKEFVNFLQLVVADYPSAETIYMPVDGWPLHFHPSVQAALVPQIQPFEPNLPPTWAKVKPKPEFIGMNLPIQMVCLPTYASWLNPIEKLWKMLKQDILHLFPNPNNFNELVEQAEQFFKQFEQGSRRLLQYCGLLKVDGQFYEALCKADAPFL